MQASNLVMPKVVVDIWRRIGAVCPFLLRKLIADSLLFLFLVAEWTYREKRSAHVHKFKCQPENGRNIWT